MPSDNPNTPPFYVGQPVVGTGYAGPKSRIKKGEHYVISSVHYSECKGNYYWYVGVKEAHDWLTPKLFAPIIADMVAVTFENIVEFEPVSNN